MKLQKLFFTIFSLCILIVTAQNQHDDANAAFPSNLLINDTNATTGWTSGGTISSIVPTPINNGAYALQLVSTALTDNERVIEYTFDATISEVYNVSIWVKENDANNTGDNRPEFSNWSDLTGFSTTIITTGTTWTEYTFSVTATSVSPVIRIYAHTNLGIIGDSIQIDNVSITSSTADTTPPLAVSDLNSSNITDATIDLSWTDPTDNIGVTDYGVFQNGIMIAATTSGITSYSVLSLTASTSYDFTVYAIDAANNLSPVSNTLNETTTADTTAPSAITDLSSANVAETSLDLNWTASTDNIAVTDYEVFQDAVSIGLTGGSITFNVTSLTLGNSYDFTVFAKDAAGNTSLVSNTLNETTVDITVPGAPTSLTSSNITAFTVDLSWIASTSPDVVGYRIYQDEALIGSTTGDVTYTIEELEELTSYDFYVTALDASNNESTESNTETVNTPKENAEVHYTSFNSNLISIDWTTKDLFALGNVGIGTQPDANYKLAINGNVIAEEVRVALKANWPDYVFEKSYKLPTLIEVENYINTFGHLKNIPSADETKKNGISVGEMNSKLLRKIEELTLYIIQQEKKINKLSDENQELKSLSNRLLEIEKQLQEK